MNNIAFLLLRVVTASLGGLLIYSAVFLTRTEAGHLQNILAGWWLRIGELESRTRSREVAFVKIVTQLTTDGFSFIFGERLWSERARIASICYSAASFLITEAVVIGHGHQPNKWTTVILCVVFAVVSIAIGSLEPLLPRGGEGDALIHMLWVMACSAVPLYVLASFVSSLGTQPILSLAHGHDIGWIVAIIASASLLVSIVSDVLFVIFTRFLLQSALKLTSFVKIVGFAWGNLLFGVCLAAAPIAASAVTHDERVRSILFLFGACNSFDALISSIWFALAIILLVHRILWPIIKRPLLALDDHRVFSEHRKLVFLAGVALIGFAFPQTKHLLHAFIKVGGEE